MRLNNSLSNLSFLFFLFFSSLAAASDTAKEQRWADQIVDMLIVGEAEWLEADGNKFLGIYTEDNTGEPKGGVIVIHGIGVHPNWNDVVYPLRTQLPDYGWATLSIQMPILPNDADIKEYAPLIKEAAPRIAAASRYLKEKGDEPVFIVAHSLGATMAAATLADTPALADGFVAIGMSTNDIDPMLNSIAYLENIKLPMLDMYGSRDLEQVLKTADARKKAARIAENDNYRQLQIEGADHFFVGLEDELVRRVRGWLETQVKNQ